MLRQTLFPIAAVIAIAVAPAPSALAQSFLAAPEPAAAGYAPVNGLEMYYEIHGEGGRPLVLIHGAFLTLDIAFGAFIPALAESRQVIAVELQGHGRTGDIEGRPLSYAQMADDVAALLDHLGIETADVLGYSLGGAAALSFAIRHPERIGRLVVVSATAAADGWMPVIREGIAALTPELFAGTPLETEYLRLAPNPEDWPVLIAKVQELEATGHDFAAEDIAGIGAPTLLIFGDADGVRIEHIAEIFHLLGGGVAGDYFGIPDTRLAIVPGATHVGVMMMPDVLLAMIVPFLDEPIAP